MKKQIWMAFLMAICMMSCSSSEGRKQTVSAGELEYDSLSIPIDYPYLGFYYRISCYQEGGNLYCAGYNHLMHSIEVFDLTNRRTIQSYELEPEGPNAVLKNQISDFLANDSLFVFRGFRNDVKVLSRKDGTLRKTIITLSPEDNYQLHYRGAHDASYGGFEMRWDGGKVVTPPVLQADSDGGRQVGLDGGLGYGGSGNPALVVSRRDEGRHGAVWKSVIPEFHRSGGQMGVQLRLFLPGVCL